jgi:hypothetical protein
LRNPATEQQSYFVGGGSCARTKYRKAGATPPVNGYDALFPVLATTPGSKPLPLEPDPLVPPPPESDASLPTVGSVMSVGLRPAAARAIKVAVGEDTGQPRDTHCRAAPRHALQASPFCSNLPLDALRQMGNWPACDNRERAALLHRALLENAHVTPVLTSNMGFRTLCT